MILAYVSMCLIFGTTFLVIKLGLDTGFPPFLFAGIRFTVAGLILLIVLKIKKMVFPSSFKEYLQLFYVGLCMTGITFGTLYWAEQYISSGLAAILSATGPLMITLLSFYTDRVSIPFTQLIGLIIGFLGVFLIMLPALQQGITFIWVAALTVVVGEFFYCLGTIHSKSILSRKISPFMLNGFQMLFGGISLIIVSLFVEPLTFQVTDGTMALFSLVYLIVIGSILGHGLFYWLIKVTNPVFPSTWLYVSPLIALLLGFVILDEKIHLWSMAGGILVLLGVFLTNWKLLRNLFRKEVEKVAKQS